MLAKSLPVRRAIARCASIAAGFGLAILLSGCIIVPAPGPYYHPHHWGY